MGVLILTGLHFVTIHPIIITTVHLNSSLRNCGIRVWFMKWQEKNLSLNIFAQHKDEWKTFMQLSRIREREMCHVTKENKKKRKEFNSLRVEVRKILHFWILKAHSIKKKMKWKRKQEKNKSENKEIFEEETHKRNLIETINKGNNLKKYAFPSCTGGGGEYHYWWQRSSAVFNIRRPSLVDLIRAGQTLILLPSTGYDFIILHLVAWLTVRKCYVYDVTAD